jgi:cysteine desulfuration protein SufE
MPTFEEIAETFRHAGADLRLDLLRDYARQLPPLPAPYAEMRDAGVGGVPECRSAAVLFAEVEDERVLLYADAPREAATARAFLAILHEAFHEKAPATVRTAPDRPLDEMGLSDALGLQRKKGLRALYRRVQQAAAE